MKKNMKTMLCFGLMIAFVIAMSALLIGCAAADPEATTEATTEVTTEATTETTTETTEETTEATTEETTEATEETTEATEETTEATEAEGGSTGDEDQTGGAENTGNGSNGGTVENTGNGGNGGTVENTGNTGNTGNTTESEPTETTAPAGPTLPSNKPGVCEHNWSDWTVTKGATTMAEGEQIRSCSKCGASETQTIPKVYINVNELIAAGNSYAASLGFTIDTSLAPGNCGYLPGIDMPLTNMADGYSYMATAVATTRNQLMHADYAAGYTESPDVFMGCRCSCNVTYAGESDMGPIYIFWVYYG